MVGPPGRHSQALALLSAPPRSATTVNAAVSACEKSSCWRHALQLMGLAEVRNVYEKLMNLAVENTG